uniref:Transposase Tnp1/En/Spm-like domain-containing protein n=1 Tax=Ananas comosus var. bracteatus TaxID=296719 RepID=A0A6V7P1T3_ANACO|nr:unnamed protein product [Ananas comosus var. bracteatus]
MQHNEILDTIPVVVNANVCPKEPSWNEVSSLQSSYEIPQNQDGSEVYLKSLKKPHNNVAQGTLLSKDPKTKVGGVELGPQCWEIQIDIPIIRVEPLLRSYKGYRTIGDAVEQVWPGHLLFASASLQAPPLLQSRPFFKTLGSTISQSRSAPGLGFLSTNLCESSCGGEKPNLMAAAVAWLCQTREDGKGVAAKGGRRSATAGAAALVEEEAEGDDRSPRSTRDREDQG